MVVVLGIAVIVDVETPGGLYVPADGEHSVISRLEGFAE